MSNHKPQSSQPPEQLYQITLNAEQVQAISTACELFTRIRIGQLDDITWKVFPEKLTSDNRELIREYLDRLGLLYRGKLSHYGSDDDWSELSEITWDLHQVLRNRLAWDRTPAGNSMNVDFDDPMPKSHRVKLAKVEGVK